MKTVFIIGILFLMVLAISVLMFRSYFVQREFRKAIQKKYDVVDVLMQKLASSQYIADTEVLAFVENPSLRHLAYRVLEHYNRLELFPENYITHEKSAESFLVSWLEYPTELGEPPDEVQLVTVVRLFPDEDIEYYVFRFRAASSRWAAQGWMFGTVGPYGANSKPYDVPLRVFSRFTPVRSGSPLREAQWVHEHINQKNIDRSPGAIRH